MDKFFDIEEGTTPILTANLKDHNGNPLPGSLLNSMRLTYYDRLSGGAVNGRDDQDVLGKHGVTVSEGGVLTWKTQVEDIQIIDHTEAFEWRRALFEWTYTSGGVPHQNHQAIIFRVYNREKIGPDVGLSPNVGFVGAGAVNPTIIIA